MGHHDDGIQRTGRMLEHLSQTGRLDLKGSDASGWDMSVCRDALYFDAERRTTRMSRADALARDLLFAEAATNSTHILVIGKELWTFHNFGVTASGIPSTSAQNSPIRAFVLLVCGATTASATGDDEVHTGDVDESLMSTTGCITKAGSETVSGPLGPIAFTSHNYFFRDGRWHAEFDNFPKMLASFDLRRAGGPPSQDVISGMRFALRHTPAADRILVAVAERLGWNVPEALPLDCRF